MVKKKVKRSISKKTRKVSKKKNSKVKVIYRTKKVKPIKRGPTKAEKVKSQFYKFQQKVDKLKMIRHEINVLDTKGFEKEVNLMKSRLKDTEAISALERQLANLRRKIKARRNVKKKSPMKNIEKRVSEIDESVEAIDRKVARRVAHVDDSIEESNAQLKREIGSLRSEIVKGLEKQKRVDAGVDVVVDNEFQDFIKGVKVDLSQRVKNKEKRLNLQLKNDLAMHKRELETKYKDMEKKLAQDSEVRGKKYELTKQKLSKRYQGKQRELEKGYTTREQKLAQDYEIKVQYGLKKEIEQKFVDELRKKFEAERSRLDVNYVSKMKKRYHNLFDRKKRELEERLRKRLEIELRVNKRLQENDKLRHVQGVKKQYAELRSKLVTGAHNELVKDIEDHRKKVSVQLKMQFTQRMNSFVDEQRKEKDREVLSKTRALGTKLAHEKEVNSMLKDNISEKVYELEKEKERNRQLVAQYDKIRSDEFRRSDEKKKLLVEKHLREIKELENKLNSDYQVKFNKNLGEQVLKLKKTVVEEYNVKKKELKQKTESTSFRKRRELKKKLKQQYSSKFLKELNAKRNELEAQSKRELERELDRKVKLERGNLKSRVAEVEEQKKKGEAELRQKFTSELGKKLAVQRVMKDKELEEKARELNNVIVNQQKVNALLAKQRQENLRLVDERDQVKHKEVMKHEVDKRVLLEQHKIDMERLTNQLNKQSRVQYDSGVRSHVTETRKKLKEEFSKKLADVKKRFSNNFTRRQTELEKKIRELNSEMESALENQKRVLEQKIGDMKKRDKNSSSEKQRELEKKIKDLTYRMKNASRKSKRVLKQKISELKKKDRIVSSGKQTELEKKIKELNENIENVSKKQRADFKHRVAEVKKKEADDFAKQTSEFEEGLKKEMDNKLKNRIEDKKKQLQIDLKQEFDVETRKRVGIETKKLQNHIRELENDYKEKLDKLGLQEKNLLESIKAKNLKLALERESLLNRINLLKEKEDTKFKNERIKMQKELTAKAHVQLIEELKRREELVKARVKKVYDVKLKEHEKMQDSELARKKAELAKELQERAQKLFS